MLQKAKKFAFFKKLNALNLSKSIKKQTDLVKKYNKHNTILEIYDIMSL